MNPSWSKTQNKPKSVGWSLKSKSRGVMEGTTINKYKQSLVVANIRSTVAKTIRAIEFILKSIHVFQCIYLQEIKAYVYRRLNSRLLVKL
jgi:hypothetical protein